MKVKLHWRQQLAFLSTATELFFGGAAGGGKSHLLRAIALMYCLRVPNVQVYLFRRISDDLMKNHMEGPTGFYVTLAGLVKARVCRITHGPIRIRFANGATIHLCHCQDEKSKYKYQGAEIHVLLIDELTHFTDSIYRYLRSRCRYPDSLEVPPAIRINGELFTFRLPLIVAGSNPGNIGHNWVKLSFVSPKPKMVVWQTPDDEGGFLRQFIPSKLKDNPSIDHQQYRKALSGLGAAHLVKAMLDGDWDIVAGGMFDDVWDPKVHVLSPFEIPKTWRIDRSFDWGSSHPYSVGWWAESDGCDITLRGGSTRSTQRGDLFRIAELYGWTGKPNKGTQELAAEVARKIIKFERGMGRFVNPGPADSQIFDTQNGNCIGDDMARIGVRWTKADKRPGSRINGWELLRGRLKNSVTREGPGLYVFDTCRQFIRTVPVLPRKQDNPDDVDKKVEDHVGDEVRYRVLEKCHSMTVRQAG